MARSPRPSDPRGDWTVMDQDFAALIDRFMGQTK